MLSNLPPFFSLSSVTEAEEEGIDIPGYDNFHKSARKIFYPKMKVVDDFIMQTLIGVGQGYGFTRWVYTGSKSGPIGGSHAEGGLHKLYYSARQYYSGSTGPFSFYLNRARYSLSLFIFLLKRNHGGLGPNDSYGSSYIPFTTRYLC